jgi:hypothetical protein
MSGYSVVDRIENGIAALETEGRGMIMVPLVLLPTGVAEGDVLLEHSGRYAIDKAETARRREYARQLFERLRGGGEES